MPEHDLSERKKKPLRRIVHRRIRRLLDLMKGFKLYPHRVRGIGQPSVCECVGGEKIAELVVKRRFRNRQDGQQQKSKAKRRRAHDDHGERAPARQAGEVPLQRLTPRSSQSRAGQRDYKSDYDEPAFDEQEHLAKMTSLNLFDAESVTLSAYRLARADDLRIGRR